MIKRFTNKTAVKKLEEAESKYGTVQGYIDHLRELNTLDDLRTGDIDIALRDINFILGEAGIYELSYVELVDCLV